LNNMPGIPLNAGFSGFICTRRINPNQHASSIALRPVRQDGPDGVCALRRFSFHQFQFAQA
jgi:hypothetical protein